MQRLYKAFFYSLQGLHAAWQDEAAFRQEVLLAVVMLPAAVWLAPDRISMLLMMASVLLVLIVELMNTAVESVVERIGAELHPLSKKAKDAGSAAVFIALVNGGLVWAVLLWPA